VVNVISKESSNYFFPELLFRYVLMLGSKSELLVHFSVDLRGGEAQKQLEAQLFAWQRNKEGDNINLLGEPTKVEILLRVQTVERERVMSENLRKLLDEYGGEEYLLARPF
jgi:hypothetical protein